MSNLGLAEVGVVALSKQKIQSIEISINGFLQNITDNICAKKLTRENFTSIG